MTDLLKLGWPLVTASFLPFAFIFLFRFLREWRAGDWKDSRIPVSPLTGSDTLAVVAVSVLCYFFAPAAVPLVVVLASAVVFLRHHLSAFDWWGLRAENMPADILAGAGYFSAALLPVYLAAGVAAWLCTRLGIPDLTQDVVRAFVKLNSASGIAAFMLYAVIIAPICEEIFFRGILLPFCRRFMGRWQAILLVSLLFGLSHWHLASLVPLTLLGAALALAYERTGRLGTSIAMHGILNLVTCFNLLMIRVYGNPAG